MKFQYEAAQGSGKSVRGTIEAIDERAAYAALQTQALTPTLLAPIRPAASATLEVTTGRVKSGDLSLATQQLAQLIEAGLPLADAYASVAAQSTHTNLSNALNDVSARITQGEAHGQALAAHPKVFPPLMRALVDAGSESGQLGAVMGKLGDHLDARDALQKKMIAAMAYPALVALVSFAVVLAMVTYVMPQVVQVFAQGKQTLPWLTRALISVSQFVQNHWLAILLSIGILIAGLFAVATFRRGLWDRLVLRMPLFGPLAREMDMTRFLQTFAMLSSAGVPVLSAMTAAGRVVQRVPLRAGVGLAQAEVAEGQPIAQAMLHSGQFPPMVVQLTANGEATGKLSAMLNRAAILSAQMVERRTTWLTSLIEPALIVVMGAIVLVLVLAVMLPIASINTIIK